MRVDARRLAPVAMLVAALAAPAARSDGGRVCASQAEDGVRATLLTSPTPLRVGRAELVFVVEDAGGRAADLAAGVRLRLRAADGSVRDLDVEVRRDGGDLLGLLLAGDLRAHLLELFDDIGDGLIHPALHEHGIDTGDDAAEPLVVDRLGHDGRRGGAVTGDVGGLAGDLLDHLRAHVLVLVLELDLLGDGDAVLGDRGRAEGLLDDDVAALGAERHLDGAGELRDPALHRLPSFLIKRDHLRGHVNPSRSMLNSGCADYADGIEVGSGRRGGAPRIGSDADHGVTRAPARADRLTRSRRGYRPRA